MDKLLLEVDSLAKKEIRKHGFPSLEDYTTTNEVGLELAKKLGADKRIVALGTRLLDIKIGEGLKEGKPAKHIPRAIKVAKKILNKHYLDPSFKKKVINCIEAHHREKPFICIEAEICANADAWKFMTPRKFLKAFYNLADKLKFEEVLQFIDEKVEEKHKNLTLDLCKRELEGNYLLMKKLLKAARRER